MNDPRMKLLITDITKKPLFDRKRMLYGGFSTRTEGIKGYEVLGCGISIYKQVRFPGTCKIIFGRLEQGRLAASQISLGDLRMEG